MRDENTRTDVIKGKMDACEFLEISYITFERRIFYKMLDAQNKCDYPVTWVGAKPHGKNQWYFDKETLEYIKNPKGLNKADETIQTVVREVLDLDRD